MRSMEQIVNRQLERWSVEARARQEALEAGDMETARESPQPWVCLSRQFGSGGGEIARRLARRLNYRLFDRELMDAIAAEFDRRRASLELLDERAQSAISLYIEGLLHGEALVKSDYLRHLMEVVLAIGHHGAAVILGRGAQFILDPAGGVNVRVIAPHDFRVESISHRYDLPREEARQRMDEVERTRVDYMRKYFKKDPNDAIHYDLVLNSARLGTEACIRIIEEAHAQKMETRAGSG